MQINDHRDFILHEFASMVPVAPMQISLTELSDQKIHLHAPLASHINDKGNAFGGSLSSVMTLACWALMTARTREAGLTCDVYVAEVHAKYLKPVEQDLEITAWFKDPEAIAGFLGQLRSKGKARLTLSAQTVLAEGAATVGATLTGSFVAFVKK